MSGSYDSLPCPKCDHSMMPGFIADVGYGQILQTSWTPGAPQPRRFVGGVKYDAAESVPIVTYRCTSCGYLESYARAD